FHEKAPCLNNPLGIKGAGEAGSVAAPAAIINALINALTPLNIDHIDMPATPSKIWSLLNTRLSAQAGNSHE
ncbi:MAG: hypothetical protein R3261_13595, partial [Alphaproteobacteria bacterium]|nr:hypothetical protein [Alphaproteobacteria bacterium]